MKKDAWKIKKDSELNCGTGRLFRFLKNPHFGMAIGTVVLLNINSPVSKSRKVIEENTRLLVEIDRLKRNGSSGFTDSKFIREIHYHVNRQGDLTYFGVPLKWMEEVERK